MDYGKPLISDYGDVADLTAALAEGPRTDAPFPDDTPFEDLTFS